MAGGWIKMEKGLPDKPEIWALADDLGVSIFEAIGKLHTMWAWFDDHTENGNAPCVSKRIIDRNVGSENFCESVKKVGWMVEENDQICLPNFERHNGKTAKKRALTASRVALHRSNAPSVTREEKIREEEKKSPSGQKKASKTQIELSEIPPRWTQYAETKGLSGAEREFERFRNHALQNDRRVADWYAAWRNWVIKALEFKTDGKRKNRVEQGISDTERWADDMRRRARGG